MVRSRPLSIEHLFRALADRTRLRLLSLMSRREICVCYFVEVLKMHQPKISRHLAYLRRAGLVTARREGKWMHYRLAVPADPNIARILKDVLAMLSTDPVMVRDGERLGSASCAPQRFVALQGAPVPVTLSRRELAAAVHD